MGPTPQLIADNQASFAYVIPELVVILGILGLFILDIFIRKHPRQRAIHTAVAFLVALVAMALLFTTRTHDPVSLFNGLLVHDSFAWFFRFFALATTLVVIPLVPGYDEITTPRIGEFYALMLTIVLGMLLLPGSTHLLMILLALELLSLVSYVLTAYRKGVRISSEGALKYVIYGGVATGTMLYGFSLLYGLSGGATLFALHQGFVEAIDGFYVAHAFGDPTVFKVTLTVAVVFVVVGFGYKIAAAPFHLWTPDAYEGAPTPFTAFLSVGPKAAGLAVMIRFFFGVFTELDPTAWANGVVTTLTDLPWPEILGILAMATMTVGNVTALAQDNVKRMLAFSSIAHAGYMLMGLAVASTLGIEAVILYALIYLFMNLGAFAVVIAVATSVGGDDISDFRGLSRRAPFAATALAIFLFSLTGLPPLAGFIGKYYLFYAVIFQGGSFMWVLAIVGAINGAVSLYYYARLVKVMFLEKPVTEAPVRLGVLPGAVTAVMMLATLVFGVYWSPLVEASRSALQTQPLAASVPPELAAAPGPATDDALARARP